MLVKIADQAMFTLEPTITVNNSEGAIFMQLIFQIFQGTDMLNQYFEQILTRVLERLYGKTQSPVKQTLKKHLLGVFLSAMIYNASACIKLMEMKGVSKQVMMDIINLKNTFKITYEQKCFIVGMTNILGVHDAPDAIKDPSTISRLIQEILTMLEKVQKKESKEAEKKAKKQIRQEEDEADSDDEDDMTSDSESEEKEYQLQENGKRSRGNSDAMEDDQEEEKKG